MFAFTKHHFWRSFTVLEEGASENQLGKVKEQNTVAVKLP